MQFDYVCFVSAHLPAPNSKEAGQKLAYQRLQWLAKHYKIILLSFVNETELSTKDDRLYDFCAETHFYQVDNRKRIKSVLTNINKPLVVSARYDSDLEQMLKSYYSRQDRILFWYEYTQLCQYIPPNKSSNHRHAVVCHDMLCQMFERKLKYQQGIKRALLAFEQKRVMRWEQENLSRCDKILSLSNKDKRILEQNYSLFTTDVLYPRINAYNNAYQAGAEPIVLFWGAMNRAENSSAVMWFVENVWSDLQAKHREVRLVVMGANPPEPILNLAGRYPNVTVTGFVDSPKEYFESAYIAIAPLLTGAGIKIKVLECLAAGIPVVGTDIAAEGIPATSTDGLIVANDKRSFWAQCDELLTDMQQRNRLHVAAHKWYQEKYMPLAESEERLLQLVEAL